MKVKCPACGNQFEVTHKPWKSITQNAHCFRCKNKFMPYVNQGNDFHLIPSSQPHESRDDYKKRQNRNKKKESSQSKGNSQGQQRKKDQSQRSQGQQRKKDQSQRSQGQQRKKDQAQHSKSHSQRQQRKKGQSQRSQGQSRVGSTVILYCVGCHRKNEFVRRKITCNSIFGERVNFNDNSYIYIGKGQSHLGDECTSCRRFIVR